jgi:hypothetical protein
MFRNDCYFAQRNSKTGVMEWYFYSREGLQGPFPSKEIAIVTRKAYSNFCKERGIDGGREHHPRTTMYSAGKPVADIMFPEAPPAGD